MILNESIRRFNYYCMHFLFKSNPGFGKIIGKSYDVHSKRATSPMILTMGYYRAPIMAL